jgi:hypothetical protein
MAGHPGSADIAIKSLFVKMIQAFGRYNDDIAVIYNFKILDKFRCQLRIAVANDPKLPDMGPGFADLIIMCGLAYG